MRQFLKSGSVRGVRSNPHPYRDRLSGLTPLWYKEILEFQQH